MQAGSVGVEIEASDVIKLLLQFCKENNLSQTFAALSRESQVSLNTVDNAAAFLADVRSGRWDVVLPQVALLHLPRSLLEDLYELVVLEMVELRELDVARALLRQTAVLCELRSSDVQRLLRLEKLVANPLFEPQLAWPGADGRDGQRQRVAAALAEELEVAPPSRLLALLGQALKWQQHTGHLPSNAVFDLFRGAPPAQRDEADHPPTAESRVVRFGTSNAEAATFSPDGQFLVTGSSDGIVEVWDASSGTQRRDLAYQAEEAYMLHSTAILALAVSRDSELLASGSADGAVKVWRILTGACVRRYDAAHSGAVTSLSFSRDSAHVLSSSLDGTARIHGLKSGRMLRELRGHDGFVHCAAYSSDCEHVATGSADGTMRVWAARTGETLVVVRVPSGGGGPTPAVLGVSFLPQTTGSPQLLLLCLGSDRLQLATLGGTLGLTLHANTPVSAHFVAATASPRGGWIYGLTQAGVVCCFRAATGQLERRLEAHEGVAAIGLCHHPHANRLATFARDHLLKLWSA